jgi:hypothetical protein
MEYKIKTENEIWKQNDHPLNSIHKLVKFLLESPLNQTSEIKRKEFIEKIKEIYQKTHPLTSRSIISDPNKELEEKWKQPKINIQINSVLDFFFDNVVESHLKNEKITKEMLKEIFEDSLVLFKLSMDENLKLFCDHFETFESIHEKDTKEKIRTKIIKILKVITTNGLKNQSYSDLIMTSMKKNQKKRAETDLEQKKSKRIHKELETYVDEDEISFLLDQLEENVDEFKFQQIKSKYEERKSKRPKP